MSDETLVLITLVAVVALLAVAVRGLARWSRRTGRPWWRNRVLRWVAVYAFLNVLLALVGW